MSGLVAYDSPSPGSSQVHASRGSTPFLAAPDVDGPHRGSSLAFEVGEVTQVGPSKIARSSLDHTSVRSKVGPPASDEERYTNRQRFEIELEFVQSLASPKYLLELAITGVLYEEAFLNYLDYLEYWREPRYAKFITYPMCLRMLTLLRSPEFRVYLGHMQNTDILLNDNEIIWNTWRESSPTRQLRESYEAAEALARTEKAERELLAEQAKTRMEMAIKGGGAAIGKESGKEGVKGKGDGKGKSPVGTVKTLDGKARERGNSM